VPDLFRTDHDAPVTETVNEQPASHDVTGAEIVFDDVVKKYPGQAKAAVGGLSLTVPAGEMVMFVGPSGCGKTTSLKMINRLINPTSGRITIDGDDVKNHKVDDLRRKIGYVIQGGSLFPHLTVADNVGVVPGLLKWDKKRIAARTDELLDMVGLDPARYRDRYPRELSGGQQQRVGVARGLAADPPVILMDEPFGAVDPITRQRLQDEMLSIQRQLSKTIICVTHDIDEALKLGDRILILSEGGRIEQYDTPENILAAPANEFVEDFVGSGSALKSLQLTRLDEIGATQLGTVINVEGMRGTRVEKRGVILITVDSRATLNDALDAMLTSSHGAVVVTGGRGEYRGVASFQQVMEHIRQVQEQAAALSERVDGEADASSTVVANTSSTTDFDAQADEGEQR